MTHIQIHGLDTHDVHLTFIPDQPLVTTVSFWNIPLGMEPQQVDEHIQCFGEIKSNYKLKKNTSGRTIYTGVRVYNIILKKAIPRFLQIGGKQIRTKYTGQEQHLQQERDARQIEREKCEVQRQQQQYDRENQDNDTDANVTTITNVNKPETITETITDNTITVTEEKPEDIQQTLTDELLIHVLQTNADPLRIQNRTEEDTDAADYTVVKGKTKRKKTTKDSDDETTTKTLATHKYKINIDIITKMVELGGMDRLPATAFDGEDFTHSALLGLFYLLKDGNLLRTNWYDEDCPPPSNQYDLEGYGYWKVLSLFNDREIAEHISNWVNRFDGHFLHV